MRRIILFLLFLAVPVNLLAEDACTNPDEYTIDQRCYVTDEQKKEKPYNAVVGIVEGDDIDCTGTIVKENNELYVFTAKHCTENYSGDVAPYMRMQLQDGRYFFIKSEMVGDYSFDTGKNKSGDWAIYKIISDYEYRAVGDANIPKDIPFVYISNLARTYVIGQNFDASLIGYGSLKIMSDKDIDDFRQGYIKYLKEEHGVDRSFWNEDNYGFIGSGLDTKNTYVRKFIDELDDEYFYDIFDDEYLKVSNCKYSTKGNEIDCQSWGGNSGGGFFNKNGYLMGIHTRGFRVIGGKEHGKASGSILLLENIFNKLKRGKK